MYWGLFLPLLKNAHSAPMHAACRLEKSAKGDTSFKRERALQQLSNDGILYTLEA